MTRVQVVVSAMGPDRVGLVQQLTGFLTSHQANIEDSNMAALCGEFAIILLVTVPESEFGALLSQRAAMEELTGLRVSLRRPTPAAADDARPYLLTASCLDYPGLVHGLTRVAAEAGVNIESMETSTEEAPWFGTPMFRFEAHLAVPPHQDVAALESRFRAVGAERNIEVSLRPAG